MIYFVGNYDQNICKIGYSKRPHRRINTLRSSVPFELTIFDIKEGDLEDEKILHGLYNEYRIKGEWYMLDKIKETGINKNHGVIDLGLKVFYNKKTGFINLSVLVNSINEYRVKDMLPMLSIYKFISTNKEFLKSFSKNPIKKDYHVWGHPFLAIEIIRNISPHMKVNIYKNLDLFSECVNLSKSYI